MWAEGDEQANWEEAKRLVMSQPTRQRRHLKQEPHYPRPHQHYWRRAATSDSRSGECRRWQAGISDGWRAGTLARWHEMPRPLSPPQLPAQLLKIPF